MIMAAHTHSLRHSSTLEHLAVTDSSPSSLNPNMAQLDFHLVPKMKMNLQNLRFQIDEDTKVGMK
jgi:hypothetical protein